MGGSVDENASQSDKPVQFPFPDPGEDGFDEDIGEDERKHYQTFVKDLNDIKNFKLHCTACDRHLGCSTRNDSKMRIHPMLRTLVCSTCHTFYNSGEFDKGEDGSELYCRWCGQGGQVYCCSDCPIVFCAKCIRRNLGNPKIKEIENLDDWKCFNCNPKPLWDLRAVCWALLRYVDLKIKITHKTTDLELKELYTKDGTIDHSECCKDKKKRLSGPRKKEETKKPDVKETKKPDVKIESPIKIPSVIQVKKFASINLDETKKTAQKRPASPKNKLTYMTKPINISNKPSMSMLNSGFASFPKLPKMAEEAQATSLSNASPTMDDTLPPPSIPLPGQRRRLSSKDKEWIIRIFSSDRRKSIKEKLREEGFPGDLILTNKDSCVKAVAQYLNVNISTMYRFLRLHGLLYKKADVYNQPHTKLMPNPYHGPEPRKQFMPIVHTQYMPRKPPPMSAASYGPSSMMVGRPMQTYNGYPSLPADNINLSLENLTQGLDVAAMLAGSAMRKGPPSRSNDGQLVCTPDFPLEPLCEVTEENNDDDVECMTPGPVAPPIPTPGLVSASKRHSKPIDSDNIIQMTDNDVTVNAATGGLKFRVDPQTLSANKMYRLPDGRVFAINANPKMPGGYSATIVALSDNSNKQPHPPKGTTYSAKVSAINKPPPLHKSQDKRPTPAIKKSSTLQEKVVRQNSSVNNGPNKIRKCDLNVPVEWYIYNVTDAIDSMEYTLMRLKKLKKNTNSTFLRTRSAEEIRNLHKDLDRFLANSSTRFGEIRSSLTKGFKSYCQRKAIGNVFSDLDSDNEVDDDDDDVEILADNHDEPIFIDENSVDSNSAAADGQVDLVSSDLNESGEKDKSKKQSESGNENTKLNEKTNNTEEPISTSNLDNEEEKISDAETSGEKGEKDDIESSEVNTKQNNGKTNSPQPKEPGAAMELDEVTDGNLEKNDASDEEEVNAPSDAMETSNTEVDDIKASNAGDENEEDDNDKNEEEKNSSGNCDSTNAEKNCDVSDAKISTVRDDSNENETEEKGEDYIAENANDQNKSESDKEDNNKEVDLLDDSQDNIEKLDDDDIESLLKGGDELDDLAKVQCIVEMDPEFI